MKHNAQEITLFIHGVVCKVKINVIVYVTIRGVIFGFFQRLYIVIWRSYLDMNMEALT